MVRFAVFPFTQLLKPQLRVGFAPQTGLHVRDACLHGSPKSRMGAEKIRGALGYITMEAQR